MIFIIIKYTKKNFIIENQEVLCQLLIISQP